MSNLDKILAQPTVVHDLVQGTPDWDLFRVDHRGASEAAAALGLSKKVPRNELLQVKHTELPREFSDWLQKNVLDKGHEVEEMALPHVEKIIGESLYPVTYSRGILSASCDGITMDDRRAFEHKQWNEELAALVKAGTVPDEHMPQCQQIMLVTGAEELYFVVSDGTPEKMVYTKVLPDRAWWARIADGWAQFDADLEAYVLPEPVERVTAAPIETLPAVSVRMDGALAVISNLDVFGAKLREFVTRIPAKPSTEQEFADCAAAVKALEKAEEALDAAEANALGQVQSVEELTRTIATLREVSATARKATNRMVEDRKKQIRLEQVQRGRDALAAHIAALNQQLGRPYMPAIAADFAGAISGKKTVDSLRNAIDTELARAKIAASEVVGRIQINLNWLREHAKDHIALFPDTGTIVLKAPEDLQALAQNRINEHKAAEEKKAEELREKIRKEEIAKLAATPAPTAAPAQPPAADPFAAPAPVSQALNVVPMGARASRTPPTLTVGKIGERLGFALTAEFLKQLGFEPAGTARGAKLFHEADFNPICDALVAHIRTAQLERLQAA